MWGERGTEGGDRGRAARSGDAAEGAGAGRTVMPARLNSGGNLE